MGFPPKHPAIVQAIAKGLIAAPAPKREPKPELVPTLFAPPGTWLVPYAVVSESNERGNWKRVGRTIAARRAVSRALGLHLRALAEFAEHYHAGGQLRVTFVRLGGRRLDRSNLSTALKAVEDALALMLGADDGDPRWNPFWEQEPGGLAGVRIVLSCGVKGSSE